MSAKLRLPLLLSLLVLPALASSAQPSQDALDAACETARRTRIEKDKVVLVQECVDKKLQQDRAACEKFYADHGARRGKRPPLYYDLPECVAAFEYRESGSGRRR